MDLGIKKIYLNKRKDFISVFSWLYGSEDTVVVPLIHKSPRFFWAFGVLPN